MNWQDIATFAALGITFFGAIAASAAAWIAQLTYLGVKDQIRIANAQMKIAEESKQLATDELQAVREDLENNRTQLRELMRRPNISATMLRHGDDNEMRVDPGKGTGRVVKLKFVLTNNGEAIARDLFLELCFRYEHLLVDRTPGFDANVVGSVPPNMHYLHPDGTTYLKFSFDVVGVLYPEDYSREVILTLLYQPQWEYSTVLWRLYDQYGSYPKPREDERSPYGTFPPLQLAPYKPHKGSNQFE